LFRHFLAIFLVEFSTGRDGALRGLRLVSFNDNVFWKFFNGRGEIVAKLLENRAPFRYTLGGAATQRRSNAFFTLRYCLFCLF